MTEQMLLERSLRTHDEQISRLQLDVEALKDGQSKMVARLDRYDELSEKLDTVADALDGVHKAAELLTRGKRFWAKVAVVGGFIVGSINLVMASLPFVQRLWS